MRFANLSSVYSGEYKIIALLSGITGARRHGLLSTLLNLMTPSVDVDTIDICYVSSLQKSATTSGPERIKMKNFNPSAANDHPLGR